MKTLIFDYDGTLHDCIKVYAPAFRKMYRQLVTDGLAAERAFSEVEISQWLGMNIKEMWDNFMPELSDEAKQKYSQVTSREMDDLIEAGKAQLYPQALEVLRELKNRGYRLIFLSNCRINYMKAHQRIFGLGEVFTDFYCAEAFDWQPKDEIFKVIAQDYPDGKFTAIGDRYHDLELAFKNQLPSVGCLYGYGRAGELDEATIKISDVSELLNLFLNGEEK